MYQAKRVGRQLTAPQRALPTLLFAAFAGVVLALPAAPVGATLCEDQPDDPAITAFCGANAPEDIVLYDHSRLLISSMEPADHLYVFDLGDERLRPLPTDLSPVGAAENWGDPACAAPVRLVTHGLDLAPRAGGRWQLLAVNHLDRESIEFFEVLNGPGDDLRLRWRGCVMAAENAQFNDVAALPDGGFLATDPITASMQLPRMVLGAMGMGTGQVYRWTPGRGYRVVPNTEGAYPNGVLLSADGRSFYLNLYLDGEVREHDLESGAILNRVAVAKPDNSALTPDGRLLVASHDASILTLLGTIASEPAERNEIPFEIVAIRLRDFTATTLFRSEGADMGGGTVAQPVGDQLFIGAFRGDRMLRVDLQD